MKRLAIVLALTAAFGASGLTAANAAPAHPASAQVISCAGRYYSFTNTFFDTGSIEYVHGIAYQEPNYYSPMCQVEYGWTAGWYAWVIYGTNLCLTYSRDLGYNHYIACDPNIAAQEWSLYQGPGYAGAAYFVYNGYNWGTNHVLVSQGNYLPTYTGVYNNYNEDEVWLITPVS